MSTEKKPADQFDMAGDVASVNDASGFSNTVNGGAPGVQGETVAGIPSVNGKNGTKGNRGAKAFVVVVLGALLVGGLVLFLGQYITKMKSDFKAASSQKGKGGEPAAAATQLNPEGGAKQLSEKRMALGAAAVAVASAPARGTSAQALDLAQLGGEIRPLRDANGKIMLNAQGKAMGVDKDGKMVEVPPIVALGGETSDRKPLPGQESGAAPSRPPGSATPPGQTAQAEKKPPSRFGGALHADGSDAKGSSSSQQGGPQMTPASYGGASPAGGPAGGTAGTTRSALNTEVVGKLMNRLDSLMPGAGAAGSGQPTTANARPAGGQGDGPVTSQMTSSATPVAYARRSQNQSLTLPKGRQADCVLTTRIINELPGFTSCVLDSDLYGADGKVKLLDKGSDIIGEYGSSSQVGLRRLFIVWTRARTPDGVEIDLQSPGSDSLGTSGVAGYLEQRWVERIGAALLISVMKDTIALATAKEAGTGSGGSVVVQQPGQNTAQTSQNIAEQILRQTVNTKPTLYINQGERISVSVARDLDFSTVYTLRSVDSNMTAKGR